jgi:ATP-dependent Lhr-like helicase
MESIGPITANELAEKLTLPLEDINQALLGLETQGQVLRGQFRSPEEWCDRRLLARIHRRTLGKLRKEIEPVSSADFMRFLVRWQHVAPETRLHGEYGLLEVIRQLAGFEAAASTWERNLLPMRVAKYRPEMLDQLCLRGLVSWGRLSPHARFDATADPARRHRVIPTSAAPLSLFPREDTAWLLTVYRKEHDSESSRSDAVSAVAQALWHYLNEHGASFFPDLARGTGYLKAEVEEGLWELASAGLVTADGFDNIRALLDPRRRAGKGRERARRPRQSVGRWSLLRSDSHGETENHTERIARQLLRRYGVVFRDLLPRESLSIPWWNLLIEYRRLESEGEIRGGRFISGFTGEQFALAEAVESLRAVRRSGIGVPEHLKISATDPLNLVGIITPGPKIPAHALHSVILENGVPQHAINASLPFVSAG